MLEMLIIRSWKVVLTSWQYILIQMKSLLFSVRNFTMDSEVWILKQYNYAVWPRSAVTLANLVVECEPNHHQSPHPLRWRYGISILDIEDMHRLFSNATSVGKPKGNGGVVFQTTGVRGFDGRFCGSRMGRWLCSLSRLLRSSLAVKVTLWDLKFVELVVCMLQHTVSVNTMQEQNIGIIETQDMMLNKIESRTWTACFSAEFSCIRFTSMLLKLYGTEDLSEVPQASQHLHSWLQKRRIWFLLRSNLLLLFKSSFNFMLSLQAATLAFLLATGRPGATSSAVVQVVEGSDSPLTITISLLLGRAITATGLFQKFGKGKRK